MQGFFSKLNLPILAVIFVAVIFFVSIFLGYKQGKAKAEAASVYAASLEIAKGFDNFFNDQNRFPTSQEFMDTNILLMYFSALPNNVSLNAICSENFIYKRLSVSEYELNFCLASSISGFQKGWNRVNVQK